MPKGHSTIGSQRALIKRMGTQRIGITITATDPGTGAEATIYVAGLTLGTLTDAQKDSFRDQLAGVLGVSPDLITLTFESGSLIVGITINPSQISTPSDNAFVVNAQAVLSQLTNTNISNIITASGTSAVITGSPVIDPTRTTATITPTLQTISSSDYTIETFNNPIVGDDVNRCMYTLVNSNIVRINSNGLINIVCSFPESTIDFIFITANAGFLVIPSNNFEEYDGILYNGRYANKVYLVNISSGTVYMNTTEIAYAQGFGFGFNQFNNKIYYGSAEVGTLGQNYMSTIEFSNTNIPASITTIPQFVINSIVFSDVNTGYTISNNSIVKVELLNNNFAVIAGGHSDLTYRQLGTWDNVTTAVPESARTWTNVGGGAYDPFADSSTGATAWFCFISSSKLVLDTANNRLLVCDRYAQRIRAINLTNNHAVTTLAGTSPISYGHAINNNGSTFSSIELSSMGQVGVWGGSASGMPEFSKVNSTYALSTFNEPSNIALFNNTILVLDLTGTRILSNGYVNDLIVLDKKTDQIPLSSIGDATVTFKISNASYLSALTSEQITNLKAKFLSNYPFITPDNMSFSLTNGNIIATLTYNPSLDINLFSNYELSTISNLASVFSDSESILTNFKDAVTFNYFSNRFIYYGYGDPIEIGSGYKTPYGVAVDSVGNVYVADTFNYKIKKVSPSGIITEIGSGFGQTSGVAVDSVGNVYVADLGNNKVKKVSPSGIITEIGSGFSLPTGVAVDSVGNVYVTDSATTQIKKVTPSGIITEIGSGFNRPRGVAIDSVGNVYVTDGGNFKIKKVTPSGIITEIASGFSPYGVALDSVGNVYVADSANNKIKKVTPSSIITEIGGFRYVTGLAVDSSGNIYVCDVLRINPSGHNESVIKKITPNGTVTTIATGFDSPWALDVDSLGNVYVADTYNSLVKKISPTGVITEIGSGFGHVTGIALYSSNEIYVSDQTNKIVKKIDAFGITQYTTGDDLTGIYVDSTRSVYVCYGNTGILRKFAPNGTVMFTKDGFGDIVDIAIDSSYNIYVTDAISNSVKKLTPSGSVTTFATGFNGPSGIAIDSSHSIYVSDSWNKQIKKFARINAVINDADITVNVSGNVVNKCNEKVPQLNPLIMCFGPDKIYTTDLKNSIVILDQNNGTTSILTTIPPVGSYINRSFRFKGITTDGRYLTVIDVPLDCNYVYRIDTTNGNFVKVTLFPTITDVFNNTFYNNFTDTLYYKEFNTSAQPVPYKFTGLSTFIIGTSTEIFPTNYLGAFYLDKDTMCYSTLNQTIKKWNLVTGVETNVIGTEYTRLSVGGKYNYSSPVQFANIYNLNTTPPSYDSVTDTLAVVDVSAKCVILIKNVLNGVAFIDRIIGTPNTDLDSNGFVNITEITKISQNGNSVTSPFTANYSGTNNGLTANLVFTDPRHVYITPGASLIFVLNFDRSIYLSIPTSVDMWKCYSVSKIQRTIVAPFTLYNTTNPPGLTVSATYSTSTASIYVAGLTLGALTQTQQDAFKAQLAIILGVTPDLLTLTFTAGSLIVGISINKSKIITASDDAFVINTHAILAQLTNADINTIITNSGTGISITGTANIDHSRIEINIDIDLRRDCLSKYRNTKIINPIVGDDANKCMYTVLDSKIVRINKNGKVTTICDFPESTIRHIFITSNNEYLVIPSNIFSYDNLSAPGQPNTFISRHANKIYVVKISDGSIYINTTQIEYNSGEGFGFNPFNNKIYYASSETATYSQRFMSTIVFSNNIINSAPSGIPVTLINSVTFSDINNGYTFSNNSIVKINLANNTFTTIAGGNSALSYRQVGVWDNVAVSAGGTDNRWYIATGGVYGPFADNLNGLDAWFSSIGIAKLVVDTANNRLLVSDLYSHRIRAIDLSNNNYAVTTLAGTSPVFYGRAINGNGSTYTTQELASMGQVGIWNNPVSGMPAFSKVNSTYALSTFDQPSNIALFDNTLLVLEHRGTRILSNGRVNDFTVLTQ